MGNSSYVYRDKLLSIVDLMSEDEAVALLAKIRDRRIKLTPIQQVKPWPHLLSALRCIHKA